MKNILALLLFIPVLATAQTKDCVYDIEEKTDSTSLKVLPNVLIDEKIFGNTNEYLFFNLINNDGAPMLGLQLLQKSKDFIYDIVSHKVEKGETIQTICVKYLV